MTIRIFLLVLVAALAPLAGAAAAGTPGDARPAQASPAALPAPRCDGQADDTGAIQAALDTAGKVTLPAGVCIVTTLVLPSNAVLGGQGPASVLRRKPGPSRGPVVYASGAAQITITDLAVDGNATASSGGDSNILVSGSSGVLVERVRSVNSLMHGISLHDGTDTLHHSFSTIRDSIADDARQYGIEAQDTSRVVIEKNQVARSGSYGIIVYGTAENAVRNAVIAGNVVTGAGGSGIAIPFVNGGTAATPGVEDVTVTGNDVEGSARNGYVIQGRHARVTANTAARNGTLISHQGFVVNAPDVTLSGNTAIRNAGVGIDFGDCKGVVATGNLVADNGIIGIELNSTEDFVVSGNTVVDNNQGDGAGPLAAGILAHLGAGGYRFVGGTVNGDISGNVVRAGPHQRFGIKATADTANIHLEGNDAVASGAARDYEILTPAGDSGAPTPAPANRAAPAPGSTTRLP